MTASATRNGEPAYLKAPLRKTQAMYDLERRLDEFHRLRNAAEECDEPVNGRALLVAIALCVAAWIGLIAVGSVLL